MPTFDPFEAAVLIAQATRPAIPVKFVSPCCGAVCFREYLDVWDEGNGQVYPGWRLVCGLCFRDYPLDISVDS